MKPLPPLRRLRAWLNKVRINPLLILLVLLPILGWAVGIEQSVNHRRAQILEARAAYVSALTQTRTQLAGLMAKVVTDKTLTQNLSWKLNHSVQSSLDAKLENGGMDQIALYVKGCQELGRASGEKYFPLTCPTAEGAAPEGRFYWTSTEDHPGLVLTRKVPGFDDAYVVGMVRLDGNWLNVHPDLKQKMQALKLRIGPGKGAVLLREGVDAKGQALAALVSDHRMDKYLIAESGKDLAYGNPLLWPCLILALLCTSAALLSQRWKKSKVKDELQAFGDWAKSLTPGGEITLPGKERLAMTGNLQEDLLLARQMVAHAVQLKTDMVHGLSARRGLLESQLKSREEEIQKLKHRLAELAELDSLAIQLARTTGSFLERMEAFHDDAEDLEALCSRGVAAGSKSLFDVLMDWQQGIAERGARKFLRSLSETPGLNNEQDSLLDEQVMLLLTLSGEVADQASAAATRSAKLVETCAFATKLAGLWHGLALKTNAEKVCTSLAQPLEEAQGLVRMEKAFANVDFANLVTEREAECIPELPKTVWVSALYHVYLAMAELAAGQDAKIVSRMRRDQGKILFVIQATAEGGKALPKRGEKQAYHMEISRSILGPFDISLTVLPALDGPFPVSLAWSEDRTLDAGAEKDARLLPQGKEAAEPSLSLS